LFVIIPYINLKKTYTLSYKTCTVEFKYHYEIDTADDAYHLAQNKLGLCLCNAYLKRPDTATANEIMKMYKKYGRNACPDTINSAKYNNLDSILKYRNIAFDTRYMWD
jgi:hypothetical protein